MIGPFGRPGLAATLRQHCSQMTQRPGIQRLAKVGAPGLVNFATAVDYLTKPVEGCNDLHRCHHNTQACKSDIKLCV